MVLKRAADAPPIRGKMAIAWAEEWARIRPPPKQ